MQAGDSHQVTGASVPEKLPLRCVEPAAIPYDQCPQQAGRSGAAGLPVDAFPQPEPQPLQGIARRQVAGPLVEIRCPDIACSTDAVAVEPAFVVEATRVHEAVGSLQFHQQLPGLSWCRPHLRAVPAEADSARCWQRRIRPDDANHIHIKAGPQIPGVRQSGDDPFDLQHPSFQLRLELLTHAPVRLAQRPEKPQNRGRRQPGERPFEEKP